MDGTECRDAEELKALIEELNDDEKIFRLEEDESILATYEWVAKVFEELGIELAEG